MNTFNSLESSAWYVVYTKARQECLARDNLERQGFETYLPLVKTPTRRAGQLCQVVSPFFPRYMFVRFDQFTDDWAPIRSTRGVCGLVKFEGVPKPVPSELIKRLRANQDMESMQIVRPAAWEPGDSVLIENGVFAGHSCIFQERRGATRVAVMLDLVGKATRTTLSYHYLKIPEFS